MATEKSTEAEIISAQGEADAKRLEARAKLSPFVQTVYAVNDVIRQNIASILKHGYFNVLWGLFVLALVISLIISLF